jgi:hypothetical protein
MSKQDNLNYIYLQQFDGEQRTWCEDNINDDDDIYMSLEEHKRLSDIARATVYSDLAMLFYSKEVERRLVP